MDQKTFLPRESPELVLPLILYSRYLTFLARRPISESNLHYRASRVGGLRSLIPILASAPQPSVAALAEPLSTLTPANLTRIAPEIQRALRILSEPLLPRNYLSLDQPPSPSFLAGVRRVLVLIGPAIGIGDEIITFSLPRALRLLLPEADITVSSSYPQVWDRVDQVDRVQHYTDLRNLVTAIRTAPFDLLVMIDFENPKLANSLCYEPTVARYLEIALGPRRVVALDKVQHRHWHTEFDEGNFSSYYDCMRAILHWIGAPYELDTECLMPVTPRPNAAAREELIVFVNPFTSKEDPSERYWGQLLCSILPDSLDTPVRMLINTGPNLATRSLAFALARKVETHYFGRNVRVEVPSQAGKPGTTLSIADIFTFSDAADVIITADSFPAHAAQLFRRLTVVLGKPRTEPWRSPSPNSFYFSSVDPLPSVARGIRALLTDLLRASDVMPLSSAAEDLRQQIARLDALFLATEDSREDLPALQDSWARVRHAQRTFLNLAQSLSVDYDVLFGDNDYDDLLPPFVATDGELTEATPALRRHLRHRFREWKNSNLCKYILQPDQPKPATQADHG